MNNLQEAAEKAWKRIQTRQWEPTTADLITRYDLTETQVQSVKRHIRKMAGDHGVLWGWHPERERFILAAHDRPDEAREILRYVLGHWKEAGANADHAFRGAEGQGLIKANWKNRVAKLRKDFDKLIYGV
jgi:hypothetical protein